MAEIKAPIGNRKIQSREESTSGSAWRLLFFIAFVFGVFVVSGLGLQFGYARYLRSKIAIVDSNIMKLADESSNEQQDQFLNFQYQVANLQTILNNRIQVSKIFPLLESHTNKKVHYTDFSFDADTLRLDFEGIALSYDALAEQLQAYALMQEVIEYEISSARLREGGTVAFSVTLTLGKNFFEL